MFSAILIICTLSYVVGMRNPQLKLSKLRKNSVTLRSTSTSVAIDSLPKVPPSSPKISLWPCGDELDKRILGLAVPAVLNFAIIPLVGVVDTFWVGRMSNALALAGQGAANQIFSSAFYIMSFLPSVVTPLVAAAAGSKDNNKVQERVAEAFFIASMMGIVGTIFLYGLPSLALSLVLSADAPARRYAQPYLTVRAVTFLPALLARVCFAVFRGTMDFVTPLRISIVSNLVNIILDPLLIFNFGFGVAGAAAATCVAEIVAIALYIKELINRKLLSTKKMLQVPTWKALVPLLLGGATIQLRAVALNVGFLAVQRTTQALDVTGTAAAAHAIAIQFWQLGGIILLAMSTVASTIIPSVIAAANANPDNDNNADKYLPAKQAADRLMLWGVLLGTILASIQLCSLPMLSLFSTIPAVIEAARVPSILGALMNLLNGIVFIGEGIQLGNQSFKALSVTTVLGAMGMLTSLRFFGTSLTGVWASIGVLNSIRLIGVLRHHFFTSPFAVSNRKEKSKV